MSRCCRRGWTIPTSIGRGGSHGRPNSKWIALPVQPSGFLSNVAVAPAEGGRPPVRVAPAGEHQGTARWSNDGAVLIWSQYADALHVASGGAWEGDADAVRLRARRATPSDRNCVNPSLPMRRRLPRRRNDRRPARMPRTAPARAAKAAKPRDREMFTFEPDGIEDRKMTLSQGPSALVFAGFLSDGVSVLLVERRPTPRATAAA